MNFIFLIFFTFTFLVSVEICKRKFLLSNNITRKVCHIGGALIAVTTPFFLSKNLIILACFGFAILMFWSRRKNLFSAIHTNKRNTFGEVYLPLGEALAATIFLPQAVLAFQYGILVMGLSDAFAGIFGEKFGTHKINIFGAKKSLEGSAVFFITCLILTFLFAPYIGLHLIFIPLVLTLVEFILGFGLDNLAIPIIGAFLIQYFIF